MFKIHKCEVRNKQDYNIKNGETRIVNAYGGGHRHYVEEKKINGIVAGDYTLYQYDLKDIETGQLFAMKTEYNIELDGNPLYIGVEGKDIVAFSKNELNGEKKENQKNYTLIESKTSDFTIKQFFIGLLILFAYMIPFAQVVMHWSFIKDWSNEIKKDYSNYPKLVFQIIMGLMLLNYLKILYLSLGKNSNTIAGWYSYIQPLTITTGLLSFAIFIGGLCYFKVKRIKNLEQFNNI